MITYFKNTHKNPTYTEQKKFSKDTWIHVVDPKEDELEYLQNTFKLDTPELESGIDKFELPRIEREHGITYVIIKYIQDNSLETLLIVLGKSFFLTLSKRKPQFLQKILDGKMKTTVKRKPNLLMQILSQNNQAIERTTLNLVKLINTKKDQQDELSERDLKKLLDNESILNSLVSSNYYTNQVYKKLERAVKFSEDDQEELENLEIETKQGFDLCKASLKSISNLRDHYVILLSNKLNRVITLLTIFTIVISVPAAVSGLYGMNVTLPYQNNSNTFYIVISIILLIWALFFYLFKKEKIF